MSLIGFIANIREGQPPNRDFTLFRIAAMDEVLRGLGARLFIYSPRQVDPESGQVSGLLIEDGHFVSAVAPVPAINGSWYIGRDRSARPKIRGSEFRAWAAENDIEIYPLQSFSKILKDKLKSSRLVRDFDPALQPRTEAYQGTLEQLTRYVQRYRLVFLKPRFGSKGDDIYSIRRIRRGLRCAYYLARQKHEVVYKTPAEALAAFNEAIGTKRFLIQQGIAIDHHEDAPYIFRVIMLDDGEQWQWVHKAVLAAPASDIANTTQGGRNWKSIDLLGAIYGPERADELFEDLRRVSFGCTRYLDKLFPGQLMEVAFDFVLSKKQQLKVLEINTLPGMTKPGLPPQPTFQDILNRQPSEREIYEQLVLPHGSCLAHFLYRRFEEHAARESRFETGNSAVAVTGNGARSTRGGDVLADPSRLLLHQAIDRQARHLLRACLADGSFRQNQNTVANPKFDRRFEVLRHLGAIYALDQYERWRPDPRIRETSLRAGEFLKANYIAPIPGEAHLLAVWSRSEFNLLGEPDQIKLGWVGLGLVALLCLERQHPGFTPLVELRAMGEFLRWGQNADGSFRTLFEPARGSWKKGWKSTDYPGQAAFALLMMHALDPSPEWLKSAANGIAYLVRTREHKPGVRSDYWALMATARLLSLLDESETDVSRIGLVAHARRICEHILGQQVRRSTRPELNGGFNSNGRTEPTAKRLQGLLAARSFMEKEDPQFDEWLRAATSDGIDFLVRACLRDGSRLGAMTRSIRPQVDDAVSRQYGRRAREIRIDYVQHAMSAMLQYVRITDSVNADSVQM